MISCTIVVHKSRAGRVLKIIGILGLGKTTGLNNISDNKNQESKDSEGTFPFYATLFSNTSPSRI